MGAFRELVVTKMKGGVQHVRGRFMMACVQLGKWGLLGVLVRAIRGGYSLERMLGDIKSTKSDGCS